MTNNKTSFIQKHIGVVKKISKLSINLSIKLVKKFESNKIKTTNAPL